MSPTLPVLIVGAGPVGMITAWTLAHHGVKCMLIERNDSTTKWPKMDITNSRSMELLKKVGLADELRAQGVGQDYPLDVIVSSGLGERGEAIAKWHHASPNEWRRAIKERNDGSMPQEPYQRCSQAIFEAWLKLKIEKNDLIESYWSTKLIDMSERADGVIATLQDMRSGVTREVMAQYLLGCDGGGSKTRRILGIKLTGDAMPAAMYLVHFKSKDLSRIQTQGAFWHIFSVAGAVVISQDETETWTTHLPVPIDFDVSTLDPKEQIYRVLGGLGGPYKINVDEILVTSLWRPKTVVADRYRSAGGRVLITGDACHQNIPTGGYGMNTGLGDAYDIAWKLAAVITGQGGDTLLGSYESERRPVALRNVRRAAEHMQVHQDNVKKVMDNGRQVDDTVREWIRSNVAANDGENKDLGIEMDYRLHGSPVILTEEATIEPVWHPQKYHPTTLPGHRAPHVFLSNRPESIYDLLGKYFTVVDFSKDGELSSRMVGLDAARCGYVTRLHLPNEDHARTIWERDVVLVRPDHFVAWRSTPGVEYENYQLRTVLDKALGVLPSCSSLVNGSY